MSDEANADDEIGIVEDRPDSEDEHPFDMPVVPLEGDEIPLVAQDNLGHDGVDWREIDSTDDKPWLGTTYDTSPLAFALNYQQGIDPVNLAFSMTEGGVEPGFPDDSDEHYDEDEMVADPMVLYWQGKADAVRDLASIGLLRTPEGRNWSEYPESLTMSSAYKWRAIDRMQQIVDHVDEYEDTDDLPTDTVRACAEATRDAFPWDVPFPMNIHGDEDE